MSFRAAAALSAGETLRRPPRAPESAAAAAPSALTFSVPPGSSTGSEQRSLGGASPGRQNSVDRWYSSSVNRAGDPSQGADVLLARWSGSTPTEASSSSIAVERASWTGGGAGDGGGGGWSASSSGSSRSASTCADS